MSEERLSEIPGNLRANPALLSFNDAPIKIIGHFVEIAVSRKGLTRTRLDLLAPSFLNFRPLVTAKRVVERVRLNGNRSRNRQRAARISIGENRYTPERRRLYPGVTNFSY